MNLSARIDKYLARQPDVRWTVQCGDSKTFNNIIVIPAKDEYRYIPKLISSLRQNDKYCLSSTYAIVVVNNSINENVGVIKRNQETLEYLRSEILNTGIGLNLGLVDASTPGNELPERNAGVGFARKIGMDLALKYFNFNNSAKKIIISLDADCTVSKNYLKSIIEKFNEESVHAALLDFEHVYPDEAEQKSAIINYEIYIRYYVLGLKFAGSPFAHNSVGSTIVCDAESYVNVGGMNKRQAGEDFYFLEKLAKITNIGFIKGAKVYPSPRISSRVPFGTGPRIKRFISNKLDEYILFSPEIFEILKSWLREYYQAEFSLSNLNKILVNADLINPELYKFLVKNNFKNNWQNIIKNSNSKAQIENQKNLWMDGFRTLKLLHHLRDKAYPNWDMFSAINYLLRKIDLNPDFISEEKIPPLEIQMRYLEYLRKLTHG